MQTIDVNIAQSQLHTLIHQMSDSPLVLSENGQPVAGWVVTVCHHDRSSP